MLKRITGLLLLSIILSSYDPPHFHLEGSVIDKTTSNSIDSARITLRESAIFYSDSSGRFTTDWMGLGSRPELYIERKGYYPRYIVFPNENYNPDNVIIELEPAVFETSPTLSQNSLRFLNTIVKIAFSLINLITLIYILFLSKTRFKYLWIAGIVFINPAFRFLYPGYSLLNIEILNGPFYLFDYWNFPHTLLIAIPAVSIIFWILFLLKRSWILQKHDSSSKQDLTYN